MFLLLSPHLFKTLLLQVPVRMPIKKSMKFKYLPVVLYLYLINLLGQWFSTKAEALAILVQSPCQVWAMDLDQDTQTF